MSWGIVASVGASLVGSAMASDAAGDAAEGQQASTDRATDLQRYIYDNNVKLNQPAIQGGNLARNRLMQLLGLDTGTTSSTAGGPTRDELRAQLLPQFTSAPTPDRYVGGGPEWDGDVVRGSPGVVDERALQQAIDARYTDPTTVATTDPRAADFGSLNTPFTGADLASEPGYQFGLNEGYKGLDRAAASRGGYFSGMALKAAQRFGQDYAGTKFGEAFNRDTTNKTNTFNRLMGLISPGQTAANQVQTAGQNYANNTGDLLTNNANAQGAAGIASANAWSNGLTGAARSYTDYNTTNSLLKQLNSSPGYWPSDMGQSWSFDK